MRRMRESGAIAHPTNGLGELKAMPAESLLAVEEKRIAWSLLAGVALLALLVWISSTFFPA